MQFSVAKTLTATTVVAAGLAQASVIDDDHLIPDWTIGFVLGGLTFAAAFGLLQQIAWPPSANGDHRWQILPRRVYLVLIVLGLALAVYDVNVEPQASGRYSFLADQSATASDEALPLWYVTLFLAAMTQPWMTRSSTPCPNRIRRGVRGAVSALTAIGLLAISIIFTRELLIVPVLVDMAVQGFFLGVQQPAAMGSEHFVEHFGRAPQQLRHFVDWQIVPWLLLFAALVVALWSGRSKRPLIWSILLILSLPAVVNGFYLATGMAVAFAPLMIREDWQDGSAWHWRTLFTVVLLGIYLAARAPTRFHHQSPAIETEATMPRRYISDSILVDIGLLSLGFLQGVEMVGSTSSLPFPLAWAERFLLFVESMAYPEFLYLVLPLPLGLQMLYRRWRFANTATVRWPHFESVDAWYVPVIVLMLTLTALLAIPFGFAVHHAW